MNAEQGVIEFWARVREFVEANGIDLHRAAGPVVVDLGEDDSGHWEMALNPLATKAEAVMGDGYRAVVLPLSVFVFRDGWPAVLATPGGMTEAGGRTPEEEGAAAGFLARLAAVRHTFAIQERGPAR